jgi:hypothetical protein
MFTLPNVDVLFQLYSDFWFVSGITRTIRKQLAVSSVPIYFYCFAFDGKIGLLDLDLGSNRLPGKTIAFTCQVTTIIQNSCSSHDFLTSGSLRMFHTEKYHLLGYNALQFIEIYQIVCELTVFLFRIEIRAN